MKNIFLSSILAIALIITPFPVYAGESSSTADNPLKKEMRLLDRAYKNLIDALVFDRLSAIEKPFQAVHEAKRETEDAILRGALKLPKNSDRLKLFMEMDKAFHARIEKLLEAVNKKDRDAIRSGTQALLDDCIQCHGKFRN